MRAPPAALRVRLGSTKAAAPNGLVISVKYRVSTARGPISTKVLTPASIKVRIAASKFTGSRTLRHQYAASIAFGPTRSPVTEEYIGSAAARISRPLKERTRSAPIGSIDAL